MTSEIEKMYENCNIKPKQKGYCDWGDYCPRPYNKCDDECPSWIAEVKYQPFTAEKQLELIKFLMKQEDFSWTTAQQGKNTEYAFYVGYEYSSGSFKEFTEALAGLINEMWQDLTEEERKQVKEILG